MFERYTEKARKVIFFARYETSQMGADSIATEHLLLGLLRQDSALIRRFLPPAESIEAVKRDVLERAPKEDMKFSVSVDLPLTGESKRALIYAAEDADTLSHKPITTAHLLLGLLREKDCLASEVLRAHGVEYSAVFSQLERDGSSLKSDSRDSSRPLQGFVPDEETAVRIAEAVWIGLYGHREIELQKPYKAELDKGVWTVTGACLDQGTPRVPRARISKWDGAILKVTMD